MEQFSFSYSLADKMELPADIIALIDAAQLATGAAYAPYSGFHVGAAALFANGKIKTGSNHENASYPAGICAERALLSGIDYLDKEQKIIAIAVAYHTNDHKGALLSPCGICRQVILETQQVQGSVITMYMTNPGGDVLIVNDASYLLPFYFSKHNLGT